MTLNDLSDIAQVVIGDAHLPALAAAPFSSFEERWKAAEAISPAGTP